MNTYDGASNPALQAVTAPIQPWTGTVMPAISHAAFQEYQHLMIHQVAMYPISIETAAQQAAARAAEISRVLERDDRDPKQKPERTSKKRENGVSTSQSHSRSSKSKSASPTKRDHVERESYSPRDQRRYMTYRQSSYKFRGYVDRRGYRGSHYRRYSEGYCGREYPYYDRRGRRSSPLRSDSLWYRHDESCSPKHHYSPSPRSDRRRPRDMNRHSVSRSPVRITNTSSNPARIRSPRKTVTMSLSPSRSSQGGNISNLSTKDNPGSNYLRSSEISEADNKEVKIKVVSVKGPLKKRTDSKSSSRVESTSLDRSNGKGTPGRITSASKEHSISSVSSVKGATSGASKHADYGNDLAVSVPCLSTGGLDGSPHKLDHRSKIHKGGIEDWCGAVIGSNLENRSRRDSTVKAVSRKKELPHTCSLGFHSCPEVQIDCWKQPEDLNFVEVSDRICNELITLAPSIEQDSIHGQNAITPLPDANDIDQNMMLEDNLGEFDQGPEYHIRTPVRLPDVPWVDTEHVSEIPTDCQYPEKRCKSKSCNWERRGKHGQRHHKRSKRGGSKEDEVQRKNERKLK